MILRHLFAISLLVTTAGCHAPGGAENLQPLVAATMSCCSAIKGPTPPSPDEGCGCSGRCTNGRYKADGTVVVECDAACPCGCRKAAPTAAAKLCPKCLNTRNVMGPGGVVTPCAACCKNGKCPVKP